MTWLTTSRRLVIGRPLMGFTVTVSFARGYFLGSESLYLTGAGMARAVFFFSSRLPPVLLARFAAQLLRGAIPGSK